MVLKYNCRGTHSVKSVRIRNFSGPYFPEFRLNTERYSVSLSIQSKYCKTRSRKTQSMNAFYPVSSF